MKKFEDLSFCDHYMFEKVLQNAEICKELLERLLKIKIEKLEYPEIEKAISPYYDSHGVRLDVYVKDNDKVFDIELQNAIDIDLPLRTRYYQSMIDTNNLLKGEHYSELPQSFVIFICNYDPFNLNLPCYSFANRCNENPTLVLDDKTARKIFNAVSYESEKDVAIKSLLQYICNKEPVDDFTNQIDAFVSRIKQQEVNRKEYQSVNIHDQDTFRRGLNEGSHQKAVETARSMLKDKMDLSIIERYTGLPLDEVRQLSQPQ